MKKTSSGNQVFIWDLGTPNACKLQNKAPAGNVGKLHDILLISFAASTKKKNCIIMQSCNANVKIRLITMKSLASNWISSSYCLARSCKKLASCCEQKIVRVHTEAPCLESNANSMWSKVYFASCSEPPRLSLILHYRISNFIL